MIIHDLPHFRETVFGETPDGYLLDGAHLVPIKRIVAAPEARRLGADALLPPEALAQIRTVDNALAGLRTVATVNEVHARVIEAGAPVLGDADLAALRQAAERSRQQSE